MILTVGNGEQNLVDLPWLYPEAEVIEMNQTCSNCEHLCVLNRNKVYAVCDETGKVFELWQMDTRATDGCGSYTPAEKNKNGKT